MEVPLLSLYLPWYPKHHSLQAYLGSSSAAAQRLRAQQEARNVAEQLADLRLGARYKSHNVEQH